MGAFAAALPPRPARVEAAVLRQERRAEHGPDGGRRDDDRRREPPAPHDTEARSTAPGFRMPFGSRAALTARIIPSLTGSA